MAKQFEVTHQAVELSCNGTCPAAWESKDSEVAPQHVPGKLNLEADWLEAHQPRADASQPRGRQTQTDDSPISLSERSMIMAPPATPGSPWAQQMVQPVGGFESLWCSRKK